MLSNHSSQNFFSSSSTSSLCIKKMNSPSYLTLFHSGELEKRAEKAAEMLHSCVFCERRCRKDRYVSVGSCKTKDLPVVCSYSPHFGEEECLVGTNGSGTIFFSWCNLSCVFCQNSDISQRGEGDVVSNEDLAEIMLKLQKVGCHNINFVSPTHVTSSILSALVIAVRSGLKIPIVWNTGGYDSLETLKLLDGVVDIYMPDMKYSDNEIGRRLSGVKEYWDVNKAAVREMYRQVGDLVIENGVALRGLLIRHLVLPNGQAGTEKVVWFLKDEISQNTYINVMGQYHPCFKAKSFDNISRPVSHEEVMHAQELAQQCGLRLDERIGRKAAFLRTFEW